MPGGLRVAFAGTPAFADRALARLLESRHTVVAVLTQPDRLAGRGQKPTASPVKQRAIAAGIPVLQPPTLRQRGAPTGTGSTGPAGAAQPDQSDRSAESDQSDQSAESAEARALRLTRNAAAADALAALATLAPDVLVVAAYGLILPPPVLELPRLGCLNIHASLLPRWRGAAPIIRAVEAGDRETGICIMRMDAGLDTGAVGLVRTTPIGETESAGALHDRLAELGADAIVEVLDVLGEVSTDRVIEFRPQAEIGVSYAQKIGKAEARIDWRDDAAVIARRIRAFDPQPAAHATLARLPGTPIRLFGARAEVLPPAAGGDSAAPGTIVRCDAAGLVIACGRGAIRVTELQRAGGRRLALTDFVRGCPLTAGDRFD
ncbi:MAG: methionyl-tRNA formyltransferase [Lautropia sp.]